MCGEEGQIKPHIVDLGSFTGGTTYATCIVCGGIASIGISQVISTGELPRTENGSFILPNGIIVLADEDMEAYFDGTLEFIYPSDKLETE